MHQDAYMPLTSTPIGDELRHRRCRLRLSQRDLAGLTGGKVSQTTICRLEAGGQAPTPRVLRALEAQLGRFDEPPPALTLAAPAQESS